MKSQLTTTLMAVLLVGGFAMAAETGAMPTDHPASGAMEPMKSNHAAGVVKGIDVGKGTITLALEAVPDIHWPAMTMAFKISKELAATVKPADRVNVEFVAKGMDATVTKIEVAK